MKAAIVVPTLDIVKAAEVAGRAAARAGVRTATVIVCDRKRRGGVKTGNAALRGALRLGPPFIAYLNDDVEVEQKGWLKEMIGALEQNPRYGVAAPSGPCRIKPQKDTGPGAPYGVIEVERPLSWFCAVVRRQTLEDVGLFDPGLIHYGDETDFHRRAALKGWKSVWVRHVYVHHRPGPLDQKWKQHDVAHLKRKWK